MLDLTSFTLFVMLTGRLGELALSASNIALSINTLSFMPVIGIGIAATVLVGQYQGRRRPDLAEKAGWTALKMGLIHMGAMGLSFVIFPSFYISLFTHGPAGTLSFQEVYPTARLLLIMLAIWGIGDAFDLVLAKALSGAGDTRFVMYYSLAYAYGVFVLGEIVVIFWLKLGIVAAWAWTTFYVLTMAIGFIWRFRGGRWKKIDMLGRGELPAEGPDAWTEAAERGGGTVIPPGPRE
jgi:MATE family multidrug resistance protein